MKKFEEVFDINDYEIETDEGYVDINKLMVTEKYDVYKVVIGNKEIKCADKHIFIDENNKEVYAIDSLGHKIKTDEGIQEVTSVVSLGYSENMYDLELKEHHKYYTNGILSHNTTVVGGYLLHMAVFNEKYHIACLANKLDQAQEILSRIQESYEGLPWFLQMGVKTWNKRSMELGNKTKVFVAATSKNAVRGKSLNCLGGGTIITVENKNTRQVKNVNFTDLEREYNADLFGVNQEPESRNIIRI